MAIHAIIQGSRSTNLNGIILVKIIGEHTKNNILFKMN